MANGEPADLAEILEDYSRAWAAIATDGIADFWRGDHFRFYKAEEIRETYTEFPALLAYWRANEGFHETVDLKFSGLLDLGIPGPARLTTARLDWNIGFREDAADPNGVPFRHAGKALSGWNQVMSLWEEVDNRWYLTGWIEAPDAAVVYLTDLYYRMAEVGSEAD